MKAFVEKIRSPAGNHAPATGDGMSEGRPTRGDDFLGGAGTDVPAGTGLAEDLISRKVVTEAEFLKEMGRRFDLPLHTALSLEEARLDFTRTVSIQYLKKHLMIPLDLPGGRVIALRDPTNFQPLDDLRNLLEWNDAPVVLSTQAAILSAINRAYDEQTGSAEDFVQDMDEESPDSIISEIEETADLLDDTSDAPVIKLVNLILSRAVKERASDIHLEPYQHTVTVRYRIDGVLYNSLNLPKHVQSALVSRVKVMARLNIAEKRLPQDGRIDIRIGDKEVDIRVSVIPTAFGERVVLRLLDKTGVIFRLDDLGIDEKRLRLFDGLIHSPHGIILVTGPTGSGKTTTLYGALSTINNPDINIITIEDPVEYQMNGIGQIQVNPKIGLTFARGLRSIVRQDPDVILVGEIRDRETAEIAIQSSLTGHLVFSTLHTNDAAGAITRITDMGIEPFLVSSSVIAVIAQRLVRVLCTECRESYVPDGEALEKIGADPDLFNGRTVYRSVGCPACMNTGFRGRTAIFEMMVFDDELKKLVLTTADANRIREVAVKAGMMTLLQDGVRKVMDGVTTIEEVFRVTRT